MVRNYYGQVHAGYGTENNFGSTTFFGGLAIGKPLGKKWFLEAGITRITTAIYNAYDNQDYDGEKQKYKSWFLTPKVGFTLLGRNDRFFSTTVAIGPSLKYFDYKLFRTGVIKYYFDGRRIPIDSTLQWHEKKGVNLSLYTGISFDFQLSQKWTAGLFVDGYTHRIWIEHFLPGVKLMYRMKN